MSEDEPQYETREVYEQRRQAVAAAILAATDHFNMAGFVMGDDLPGADPMCGTTLCIAGWAAMHAPGVSLVRADDGASWLHRGDVPVDIEGTAGEWLGLSVLDADALFYGDFADATVLGLRALAEITPEEAVAALMAAPYVCDPTPDDGLGLRHLLTEMCKTEAPDEISADQAVEIGQTA